MKVNGKKTQILCIHNNNFANVSSYIRTETGEITSTNRLKILGFYFDQTPSATCHVTEIISRFYGKLWTLRFLKKSGMGTDGLLQVYQTIIRAAVEYCSVVYHSLIPQYMADRLELVQRQALRIIYGRGMEYENMVNGGEIETLAERREKACLRFATKAAASERFGEKWFRKKEDTGPTVRTKTRRKYYERKCRTERFRNNPVNSMTRILNDYYTKNK